MSVKLAYIFPDILPEERIVFPLIPFFEQILFLRPVEDDLPELASPLFLWLSRREIQVFLSTPVRPRLQGIV